MIKTKEELLNDRNKLAATLGTPEVQEVLQAELTAARATMTAYNIGANDPHAYNLHRYLGRVEMLEFLIAKGKKAAEPMKTETKGQSK
jgi:hypothetical protein